MIGIEISVLTTSGNIVVLGVIGGIVGNDEIEKRQNSEKIVKDLKETLEYQDSVYLSFPCIKTGKTVVIPNMKKFDTVFFEVVDTSPKVFGN